MIIHARLTPETHYFAAGPARGCWPTSKLDASRMPAEAGVAPASYPTVNRRLPVYPSDSFRQLAAACAAHARLGLPAQHAPEGPNVPGCEIPGNRGTTSHRS